MPNVTDRISRDWAAQPMTKAEFYALPVIAAIERRRITGTTMTPADYNGLYEDMCTWIWYRDHPGYPRDGFGHTSDVCKRDAYQIFLLLGIVPSPADQEEMQLLIEKHGAAIVEYMKRGRENDEPETVIETPSPPDDAIDDLVQSREPGIAIEMSGFGFTSFDPKDVIVDQGHPPTVCGETSFYLTPADVERLRRFLDEHPSQRNDEHNTTT
jgi:hypothetical protein